MPKQQKKLAKVAAAQAAIDDLFVDATVADAEKVLAEGVDQAQIDAATALVDTIADEDTKLAGQTTIAIAQALLDADTQ
ncbi:MAG TPA: hypothetical protein DEF42_16570 [Desulfosporosinus sp.]|nr:hypothetical protein [Desulfosporosinus sp.]